MANGEGLGGGLGAAGGLVGAASSDLEDVDARPAGAAAPVPALAAAAAGGAEGQSEPAPTRPGGTSTLGQPGRLAAHPAADPAAAAAAAPSGGVDPTVPQFKKKKKKKKPLRSPMFSDKYEWTGVILGSGAYSTVREAKHIGMEELFAVKVISARKDESLAIQDSVREQVLDEYMMLQRCRMEDDTPHPNILCVVDFFEEAEDYMMVFEKMRGGELLQHIYLRVTFTEREAADVTRDIASALAHLHDRGIAHRDLKPQNILCATTDRASPAKLADFNLGHLSADGSQSPVISRDPVGTPDYMSPEVVRQQMGEDITYSKSCDVWGLGVIVYIMLSGEAPFDAGECGLDTCGWRDGDHCWRCLENLQDEITDGHLTFMSERWATISGAAKDLIGRMLVPEESRISARDILRHPWVKQIAPSTPLATPDILRRPSAVDFLNSFAADANLTNRALDGSDEEFRGVVLPVGITKSSMMERRQRRRASHAPAMLSSFSDVKDLDLSAVATPRLPRLPFSKSQ